MSALDVAVVAIGRNEGERLRRCLDSVVGQACCVVYVDSGSSDDSVAMARRRGVHVVELDMRRPFTAARARNVGFQKVRELAPSVQFVQFVDGDCEVVPGWLEHAAHYLAEHPTVAAASGRLRERYPDRSIYNRLCDMEWDVAPGSIKSCGGNAMLRAEAFQAAGGFRDDLIAGEEPELCVRLRANGWTIYCIDHPMAWHDAAITRLHQWWRRIKRSGYAFAEGAFLHGRAPERHRVRESRRAWLWGLGMPVVIAAGALAIGPWVLAALVIYPLQVLRLYLRPGGTRRERLLKATFQTLGRFPEAAGQMQFWANRLMHRRARLIEYK